MPTESIKQLAKECNVLIDEHGGPNGEPWVYGTRSNLAAFQCALNHKHMIDETIKLYTE